MKIFCENGYKHVGDNCLLNGECESGCCGKGKCVQEGICKEHGKDDDDLCDHSIECKSECCAHKKCANNCNKFLFVLLFGGLGLFLVVSIMAFFVYRHKKREQIKNRISRDIFLDQNSERKKYDDRRKEWERTQSKARLVALNEDLDEDDYYID